MTSPLIHSTALMPVEFIPATQDADSYRRLKTAEIRKREQALERAKAMTLDGASQAEIDEHKADLEMRAEAIRAEWALMERTLTTMKTLYPVPQKFMIAVPTSVEREQVNARLISLGLTQVTQEMIRSTMIEELFHQDWSEPGKPPLTPEENEAVAEGHANFLDGVWQRQEAHDAAVAKFEEQETERLLDELNGAPARPRAELPVKIITVREQARQALLADTMMAKSQRMRDLAAQAMDFTRRNSVLLVRMHLVGVEGFTPTVPVERDRISNALSEEAVTSLREQVDDASWTDLLTFIDKMYQIDGGEEKNSASPPEKPSLPGGSTEPSDEPASSGGSSTISSSSPLPADASETIIETSSGSTSDSGTAPATDPSNIPTAEA